MLRDLPSLELGAHRLPGDEVAHGVPLVQGIKKVTHLDAVPDEGALKRRDGDLPTLDEAQEGIDGALLDGVLGHGVELSCAYQA